MLARIKNFNLWHAFVYYNTTGSNPSRQWEHDLSLISEFFKYQISYDIQVGKTSNFCKIDFIWIA